MAQRRPWTPEEDEVLRTLHEVDKMTKWSQISDVMERVHNIEGRNGKQCRERYHNHLKGGIKKEKWTLEEEQLLVNLHAEHGNRWAFISKFIEGRTQNCVKNMLYSRMRKSVRQLNRMVYGFFKKELKQIKMSFINRLIEITETAYKKAKPDRSDQENNAVMIKNGILAMILYEAEEASPSKRAQIKRLIQDIHLFKKNNQKRQRGIALAKIKKQKMKKKQSLEIDEVEVKNDQKRAKGAKIVKNKKTQTERYEDLLKPKETIMLLNESSPQKSVSGQLMTEEELEQFFAKDEQEYIEIIKVQQPDCSCDFLNLLEDEDLERPIGYESIQHPYSTNSLSNNFMMLDDFINGWEKPNMFQ